MAKRKYSSSVMTSRNFRKKYNRTKRRYNASRKRRGLSWTTSSGSAKSMNYRSKKLKRSSYRSHLWRMTLAETHFRSAGNTATTVTTGTSPGSGTVSLVLPTFIGTPGPTTAFWTTTGGLQIPDVGSSAYTFSGGNMVIRGGQVGITISAPDTVTDDCNVKIFVVSLAARPDFTLLPGTAPYGTMIDSNPDFSRFGKILYVKERTMNYQSPTFTLVHRLRVQKIDIEDWGTTLGSQIAFVVVATNMIDTTANALSAVVWHDMSFAADVVTSTL